MCVRLVFAVAGIHHGRIMRPGEIMRRSELGLLSIDKLWELHLLVSEALTAKIHSEKTLLEQRLVSLGQRPRPSEGERQRRPYPPVLPKFRNPDDPAETWAGRGRKPHWVSRQLKAGKRIEDLMIRLVAK